MLASKRGLVVVLLAASVALVVSSGAYSMAPCYYGMGVIPNPQNVPSGNPFSYRVPQVSSLIDPCDFGFNFTLTQAPAGMTISWDGLIQWTPRAGQIGQTFPVTVQLVVSYTLPTIRTVTTNQTFNAVVWNCSSVDLSVGGRLLIDPTSWAPRRKVLLQATVTNPTPVCPVQVVTGRIDLEWYPIAFPGGTIATYSLPVAPKETKLVYATYLADEETDSARFKSFLDATPSPWFKNVIMGGSASDPNLTNNQCKATFSKGLYGQNITEFLCK